MVKSNIRHRSIRSIVKRKIRKSPKDKEKIPRHCKERHKKRIIRKWNVYNMEKTKLIILILVIALGIALGYILFDKYGELRGREMLSAYREGYNQGITDVITSLIQQTQNCSSVTINLGNFTRQVIDASCLKNE